MLSILISKYFPILKWLPAYNKRNLRGDLSAGITVGVMLIPQGMAYAMIAGLPPIYGLYASTVPLILYAIFGTSRQLAVGPVAMVSLVTAAGISTLAPAGSEVFISLCIALSLLVGLIQFGLGVFRLGFLVNFLSHPIISGFTSGSALIIGFSQLKHLLGIKIPQSHYIHEIIVHAIKQFDSINWVTLIVGLGGILIIEGTKRFKIPLPGPLLAVILGILVVGGLDLSQRASVEIVGTIPRGLPQIERPNLNWETVQSLFPTALTISLVGFMESIAVAIAIQDRHKNYKVNPNQELIGLGLANIVGSFCQTFPTTGGFSRTAVNDQAGAQTQMASIFSAFLIILTLLFLTPLFYYLPEAILASVVMMAVFRLIDVKEAFYLWKSERTDFFMLIITFLTTLGLGIQQGIGVGVLLSLLMVIYRSTRPHIAILSRIPGTNYYRNIARFHNLEERKELLIIRFDAELYFANISFFKDTIEKLIIQKGKELKAIILDAESINYIDSSAMHTLANLVEELEQIKIKFFMTNVKGPVRDALKRGHLFEKIGTNNFFMDIESAVAYFDHLQEAQQDKLLKSYTLQTNIKDEKNE